VWFVNADFFIETKSKGGMGRAAKITQQANGLTGERARCPNGVMAGQPGGKGMQDSFAGKG
jgi:hypothetical protein